MIHHKIRMLQKVPKGRERTVGLKLRQNVPSVRASPWVTILSTKAGEERRRKKTKERKAEEGREEREGEKERH